MQFSQIPDHDVVKEKLTDLVNNNRLSHALLFLGKEGSGALPMAIAFAKYILCERNQSAGKEKPLSLFGDEAAQESVLWADSCGVCATCSKVNQLIHPDLHFSYPALKRDARHDKVLSTDYAASWREFIEESPYGHVSDWIDFLKANSKLKIESPANKQGNITVHECEDILRKFSLKAFENKYKILIMWMPEYLGITGNKLLKLIEEPPPDTLFIFVAEDESRILPTILSRTQLIKIPLFDHDTLSDTLVKKDGLDEEKASQIATLAEGNIREALQ
ncbi:MAG: ATP-binding protein, partial [Ginsengibacter sp.]